MERKTHFKSEEDVLKKIFVGNLSFSSTEGDIRELFEQYGTVDSVAILTDRDTGRSRGFGFVEMGNDGEATAAIQALNGADINGRPLTVNEARPKLDTRGGGGGGGGPRRGGPRREGGYGDRGGGRRY